MLVDLRVNAPAVWEYVCALQHDAAQGRVMQIRCSVCNALLGSAANTAHGPGFAATWTEWEPGGVSVKVGTTELPPRQAWRWLLNEAESAEGDWKGREGYFAPLAIPPELPQEYVPLLVRCHDHGDTIVDRLAVLRGLQRGNRDMRVKPAGEHHEIIPQQVEGLATEPGSTVRLVTRIRPTRSFGTAAEFDAWRASRLRDTPDTLGR